MFFLLSLIDGIQATAALTLSYVNSNLPLSKLTVPFELLLVLLLNIDGNLLGLAASMWEADLKDVFPHNRHIGVSERVLCILLNFKVGSKRYLGIGGSCWYFLCE